DVARPVRGNRLREKAKLLDFDIQAGFFFELSNRALMEGLAVLESATGQHPVEPVALAMSHQQYLVVFRSDDYGHARSGDGRAGSAFVSMSGQRWCALKIAALEILRQLRLLGSCQFANRSECPRRQGRNQP